MYDGSNTGKLLERMRKLKLDMIRTNYIVAICSFETPNVDHRILENTVQRILENEEFIRYFFNHADQMTMLAYDNDPTELNERVYRFINILRHELNDICPVITTVISNDVQRLGEISDAYRTAAGLLRTVSGIAAGQVINVNDTAQIASDIIMLNTPFDEDFLAKLRMASPDEIGPLLDEVMSSPEGELLNSRLGRYNALISLLKLSVKMMMRNDQNADEKDVMARLSSRFDILKAASGKDSFRSTAEKILNSALNARRENNTDAKYSHVITKAEKYVRENYCDPNISLISVANHVNMSSAYFSTVFSQTTGRSFINYLTELRIEKAKELLISTNMKLSDIAMEIGYSEPNYFSHVFRKSEGITPKEFRIRNSKY